MPCCGLTIQFLYERLVAAEAEGSEVARDLLECFLSTEDGQSGRASGQHEETREQPSRERRAAVAQDSKLPKEE
ncbi:MAG: hypothetical protein DRI39_06085 [Chloroflexi bacterium]|nr:MAG: hypothetical protein DRI39_06085 [Chloroflexota bacterium]RLC96233.1 MAG: hypothetical protein DRI40_03740 [Chloroflexota bacterium]